MESDTDGEVGSPRLETLRLIISSPGPLGFSFDSRPGAGGHRVTGVAQGGQAASSGLALGDELVEVAGRPAVAPALSSVE